MTSPAMQQPTPQLFFQTINSYQRTEALKAAIELEVFTAIGEGNSPVPEIAKRCQTSERGMRILCDYLCIMGFLAKVGGRYSLKIKTPPCFLISARRHTSVARSSFCCRLC